MVYVLEAQQFDTLRFHYVQPQSDAAIYLVTDCSDEVGTCFCGVDNAGQGGEEHLQCIAPISGLLYIILDTYGIDTGGAWSLDYSFTCCAPQSCCLADGQCRMLCERDCLEQGGSPMGEGTDCETTPCPGVPVQSESWGRIKSAYR